MSGLMVRAWRKGIALDAEVCAPGRPTSMAMFGAAILAGARAVAADAEISIIPAISGG